MPTYRTYEDQSAPGWLRQPYGQAFLRAQGIVHDYNKQLAKLAVRARLPSYGPSDAVGALGDERGLPQGASESNSAYAARVKNAWGYWAIAGRAWGILAALAGMGYTTAYVVTANGQIWGPSSGVTPPVPAVGTRLVSGGSPWATMPKPNPTPGNPPALLQEGPWCFSGVDGQTWLLDELPGAPDPLGKFWSRFAVLFSPAPASWGSIANPPTTSSSPSKDEVNRIRQVVTSFKSAMGACMGLIVDLTGGGAAGARAMWGWPVRTWGSQGGNWGQYTGVTVFQFQEQ